MYTITRKLAMVCLAVVFSVLVYGCGGGGSDMAGETPDDTDSTDGMVMTHPVDTEMVTDGLMSTPGTYTILPGESADAGDVTFTCSDVAEVSCVVTVDADGATSTGGMATAMNSAAAQARLDEAARLLAVINSVDISTVTTGLIIKPGTYTLQPGESMDLYDATFTCPADGVRCVVTVELNYDGTNTVTSVGGAATATVSADGTLKLTATGSVDMSMVTAGLTAITAGMYALQPGGNMDAGDVTFTCPVGGVPCTVTVTVTDDVDDDGEKTGTTTTTVTFLGGMAMATDSAAGKVKLAAENPNIEITGLASGYTTITVGMYTIQPGENLDVGEANFVCPAGGVPCVVTVTEEANDDGETATITITSTGGVATVRNTMAVMTTRAALTLNTANTGALNSQDDGELTAISATRSTDGNTTTITLTPSDTPATEYASNPVDTHEISGWSGQTLTRGTGADGDGLVIPEEATVYTNIIPSTPRNRTYGGDENTSGAVPAPTATLPIELDAGQGDDDSLNMVMQDMARTFTGAIGGVSGTFTCAAGATCTPVMTETNIGSQRLLENQLAQGWTFESDEYDESVALQSEDYMYFGYWLRSPEDATIPNPAYQFSAFFGGGTDAEFEVPGALTNADDALTATYRGGAAGRYVTRKLSFTDQGVVPESPAYHGRFTANAELNAYFGAHETFAEVPDGDDADELVDKPNRQNRIRGTITDFMDGDTDLGFEVTLGLQEIGSTGAIASVAGTATAKFSDTPTNTAGTGMGTWDAQFYGPNAATDAEDDVVNTTLPSGVAGQFNAGSVHTNVVGAFAAEKQ